MACKVLTTENFSVVSITYQCWRTPAVSINVYCVSLRFSGIKILSRVVPGKSQTITRSSPNMRLVNVDLPTLGRPIIANLIPECFSSSSVVVIVSFENSAQIKSVIPLLRAAVIAIGLPKPKFINSAMVVGYHPKPFVLLTTNR